MHDTMKQAANAIAAKRRHFSKLFQVRFALGIITAILCEVVKYRSHRPHQISSATAIDGIDDSFASIIADKISKTTPYIADVAKYVLANETALDSFLLNATMVAIDRAKGIKEYIIGKISINVSHSPSGRNIVKIDVFPNSEVVIVAPKTPPAPTTTYRKNANQPEMLSSVLRRGSAVASNSALEESMTAFATCFASEWSTAV